MKEINVHKIHKIFETDHSMSVGILGNIYADVECNYLSTTIETLVGLCIDLLNTSPNTTIFFPLYAGAL